MLIMNNPMIRMRLCKSLLDTLEILTAASIIRVFARTARSEAIKTVGIP